jgi:hypothetical protein
VAAPAVIVRRLLARLGDRRFVRRIELGRPPAMTLQHLRTYYAGTRPPDNALWAYISAPDASARLSAHPTPVEVANQMLAQWQASLVVGALRDDFCSAGGRPLVGWTIGRRGIGVSDRIYALEQHFPNPSPTAFRERVGLIGRRYGFRVVALRLLHPRQLAPLLVVETERDRKSFVADLPAIMALLNATSSSAQQTALTFEGFFLEARDAKGPFVRLENVNRGEVEGGQWSWDRSSIRTRTLNPSEPSHAPDDPHHCERRQNREPNWSPAPVQECPLSRVRIDVTLAREVPFSEGRASGACDLHRDRVPTWRNCEFRARQGPRPDESPARPAEGGG